jgi:predicted nucleotidyltransferase
MAMQFHNLIEALLGSKVKVKVLRTLWRYREKEFTIRELAKFLGISHMGIKKVLDELEKTNAITVRTLGRSYAFKLNVNSYAASIVERTFELERQALSELKDTIKRKMKSPLVTSVALYGSVVEGRETPRSDIDLLIVTNHKEKAEDIVAELQKDVSNRFGNSISAYYVREEDLQKRRNEPPIKQAVRNHALICGNPLE